ncbi:MAG: hypothetical protein UH641_06075, partial [Bacteroidales bacterium]|nr:hypothetical protein [Bacteroidales bacterium]
VNQVKLKIEKLVFAQSLEANTADAYLAYLEEYPEGAYGQWAKQKLKIPISNQIRNYLHKKEIYRHMIWLKNIFA